jgi:hypothetical protein
VGDQPCRAASPPTVGIISASIGHWERRARRRSRTGDGPRGATASRRRAQRERAPARTRRLGGKGDVERETTVPGVSPARTGQDQDHGLRSRRTARSSARRGTRTRSDEQEQKSGRASAASGQGPRPKVAARYVRATAATNAVRPATLMMVVARSTSRTTRARGSSARRRAGSARRRPAEAVKLVEPSITARTRAPGCIGAAGP